MFDVLQDRQHNHLRKTSKKNNITLSYRLLSYYHLISCIYIKTTTCRTLQTEAPQKDSARIFRRSGSHSAAQVPPPAWRRISLTHSGSNGRGEVPSGEVNPTGPYSKRCPKTLLASVRFGFSGFFSLQKLHLTISPSHHLQSLQSLHPV